MEVIYKKWLEANIWKLYLYMVLYSLMFFTPVIVLFFQDNGLSITQIMLIQSISSIWYILGEVPSWYFADIFGRKKALMMTWVLASIGMFGFAMWDNFYALLIAHLIWSTAWIFISGADSALMYDTLKELKKEHNYKKIWGNIVFYYSLWVSIASVIWWVLGGIDYRYPFYVMIPFMLLLIPLSASLTEPKRERVVKTQKFHLSWIIEAFRLTIVENKKLRYLLMYSSLIVAFITSAYFIYQPYFELIWLDIMYFGLVFAWFNIVVAFSAKYSHVLEEKLGVKKLLILLFILMWLSFILMSNFIYFLSFIFAFLIQFVKGFSSVVISDYVHQLTSSNIRATVLSIKSLIEKLSFAIIVLGTPIIGHS